MGGSVQDANAEIQSGGHFVGIDRPGDIDRIFINVLVGFSKIAMKNLLILGGMLGLRKKGKAGRLTHKRVVIEQRLFNQAALRLQQQ